VTAGAAHTCRGCCRSGYRLRKYHLSRSNWSSRLHSIVSPILRGGVVERRVGKRWLRLSSREFGRIDQAALGQVDQDLSVARLQRRLCRRWADLRIAG
jgi:hypothetical protein